MQTNKIYQGDCIEVMKTFPENSIDLIVTSPPYGVGIDYDTFEDDIPFEDYKLFSTNWSQGGRIFMASELWRIMQIIGFKFFGIVDLKENSPHRSKTTAWGSWMSPSAPYIYNPKECVILAYKKNHIKKVKGQPEWVGIPEEVTNEEGKTRTKMMYTEEQKREFMDLVYGEWDYFADTKQLTKATFSLDIPLKAIKILTYKNDLVLDPFAGSGTSLVAAVISDRNWIGIELSENYCGVAQKRVQHFIDKKNQPELDFEKG